MINETHICIDGKYKSPIDNLTGVPTQGKKIVVDGNKLTIRCAVRFIDPDKDIKNLYIDLIGYKKDEK